MKWGSRYPSDYVNRLYNMVSRHLTPPFRFICLTDDSSGLISGVEVFGLPDIDLPVGYESSPWRKLSLWRSDLCGLTGDVLFLDLDIVLVGSLDDFFEFSVGRYCVIENWTQLGRGIGNTSCFRFTVGSDSYLYDRFVSAPSHFISLYANEQVYVSREISRQVFWPSDWCLSFKRDLVPRFPLNYFRVPRLPSTAKLVAFPGKPDPDEALVGVWPESRWWKRIYKKILPTPWIGEHWQ